MGEKIYHEKQVKQRCALHALNNLFQDAKAFDKEQLDDICYRISPDHFINPHKNVLGLGNYDVNVIMNAVKEKNYSAVWFDKRKDPSCLNLQNIMGFILNIPSEYKIGFIPLPIRRKHWIAVRKINGVFYNLDSKLNEPEVIGKESELLDFLQEQLGCRDRELLLVVTDEVDSASTWKK